MNEIVIHWYTKMAVKLRWTIFAQYINLNIKTFVLIF